MVALGRRPRGQAGPGSQDRPSNPSHSAWPPSKPAHSRAGGRPGQQRSGSCPGPASAPARGRQAKRCRPAKAHRGSGVQGVSSLAGRGFCWVVFRASSPHLSTPFHPAGKLGARTSIRAITLFCSSGRAVWPHRASKGSLTACSLPRIISVSTRAGTVARTNPTAAGGGVVGQVGVRPRAARSARRQAGFGTSRPAAGGAMGLRARAAKRVPDWLGSRPLCSCLDCGPGSRTHPPARTVGGLRLQLVGKGVQRRAKGRQQEVEEHHNQDARGNLQG